MGFRWPERLLREGRDDASLHLFRGLSTFLPCYRGRHSFSLPYLPAHPTCLHIHLLAHHRAGVEAHGVCLRASPS